MICQGVSSEGVISWRISMARWSLAELTDCWVMRLLAGIDLSPGPFPGGKGRKEGRTDSVPDPNPSLQGGVRGRFLVVY